MTDETIIAAVYDTSERGDSFDGRMDLIFELVSRLEARNKELAKVTAAGSNLALAHDALVAKVREMREYHEKLRTETPMSYEDWDAMRKLENEVDEMVKQ